MNENGARVRWADVEAGACCGPTQPDPVSAARMRHDRARNKHASSAEAVRHARAVITHLEHDAYVAEHELREANEELLRALRVGA